MALISEDIVIDHGDGWRAFVVTGTVLHITQVKNNKILFKFDIGSTAYGSILNTGDILSTNETIYIRAAYKYKGDSPVVMTARD